MKEYDVIVVGSGAGMNIVNEALDHDLKVGLVDKGPLGGTCLNVGCIPSKMLIFPADRIVEIQEAGKLGVTAEVRGIDFLSIMERMRMSITETKSNLREGIARTEGLDFYEAEGRFIDDYTIEVKGERIRAPKIFLASGSRVIIPPIKGLDRIDYLTNESLLELRERPESLVIIGGGYIGAEYGHFFAAMGTKVTIIEIADRMLLAEEPEISELLKLKLSNRMQVYTSTRAEEIKKEHNGITVIVRDASTDKQREIKAQKLMVAAGRKSNADLLEVRNTGVETDARGYIKVNEYLETSKKNIYAVGDATGLYMFTHVANRQADIAAHNAFHGGDRMKMDYSAIPHAVYSHPQIAAVGMTEQEAKKEHAILVGMASYMDVAKGEAMMEESGFAKAIAEKESNKILGFHVIGPYAPIIIQEVIDAMASGGNMDAIGAGLHIHPALPELVVATLNNLHEH